MFPQVHFSVKMQAEPLLLDPPPYPTKVQFGLSGSSASGPASATGGGGGGGRGVAVPPLLGLEGGFAGPCERVPASASFEPTVEVVVQANAAAPSVTSTTPNKTGELRRREDKRMRKPRCCERSTAGLVPADQIPLLLVLLPLLLLPLLPLLPPSMLPLLLVVLPLLLPGGGSGTLQRTRSAFVGVQPFAQL